MSEPVLELGDLVVLGYPSPKLTKALAVIATTLHPEFARQPWIAHPDKSKESCVLASLTVRDFLIKVGIRARARSVCAIMRAVKGVEILHSLAIGHPEHTTPSTSCDWSGHLVVEAGGYLIDPTLYPKVRRHWDDLSGMIALPMNADTIEKGRQAFGLTSISGACFGDNRRGADYGFEILYLDRPQNRRWKHAPDGRDKARRMSVVRVLCKKFKTTY